MVICFDDGNPTGIRTRDLRRLFITYCVLTNCVRTAADIVESSRMEIEVFFINIHRSNTAGTTAYSFCG